MIVQKGTYSIDLTKTEDDIFNQFSKDKRWDIKKAQKNLGNMHILNSQLALVVEKECRPVSIILIDLVDSETASYHKAITLDGYAKFQFNSLLLWEAIKQCKSRGFKKLYLGGIDLDPTNKQEGINKFKAEFNGELKIWNEKVSFLDWLRWKLKKYFRK